MTVIYRLLELNNGIREEYFKSMEGVAAAALMQYKEYLLSKDILYTEDVYPTDITVESIREQIDNLSTIYEKWVTVTLVCHEVYTLTVTEVELND